MLTLLMIKPEKKMNRRALFFGLLVPAGMGLFLSCLSPADSLLPDGRGREIELASGWYECDFERTFKGVEAEYQYTLQTGGKMVEELTLKQTGVLVYVEDGFLYEPVMPVKLTVDRWGQIRGVDNGSIAGQLSEDGSFFWTGLAEQHGRLSFVTVEGKLRALPREYRADITFNGVYHLTEPGTGREQLIRISDGLYTWRYVNESVHISDGFYAWRFITDPGSTRFSPWPGFIKADGTFGSSYESVTVMEMGTTAVRQSNLFSVRGRVDPALSISLEEQAEVFQGNGRRGNPASRIYTGIAVQGEDYPSQALPADVKVLLQGPVREAMIAPPGDFFRYPRWYHDPPVRENYIFAAGGKSSGDQNTAFALAERAAAAALADKLSRGSPARDFPPDQLPYRTAIRRYDESANTAFILLELCLNDLK